ncbi:hypothetical protein PHOSAC3_120987 [Mesotoga infera]|nr:hypothetical protein PHOSAC3_120987 [Mesotoga infera]
MGAQFLSTVTAIMIENRYSNLEKQLSNFVKIIAKDNVRTVFYVSFIGTE